MNTEQRDLIAASCIFLLIFIYGVWLIIKALRQIREPTHIRHLGMAWFLNVFEAFSRGVNTNELERVLSTPTMIRLAAGCVLLVGVAMIGTAVVAWVLLYWVF
jgi:hypothetical protein